MPEEKISPQEKPKNKKKKLKAWHKVIIVLIAVIILLLIAFYVYKMGFIPKLRLSMGEIGKVQVTVTESFGPAAGTQEWKIGEKGVFYAISPITLDNIVDFLSRKDKIYHIEKEDFNKLISYLKQSKILGTDLEYCKNNSKDFTEDFCPGAEVMGKNYDVLEPTVVVEYYECRIGNNCFGQSEYEYDFSEIKELESFINDFNSILEKYEIIQVGDYSFYPDYRIKKIKTY